MTSSGFACTMDYAGFERAGLALRLVVSSCSVSHHFRGAVAAARRKARKLTISWCWFCWDWDGGLQSCPGRS